MKAPDFEQEFSRHNESYYEPPRMPRPVQLVVLNGELVALGDNGTIWRRVPVVTPWEHTTSLATREHVGWKWVPLPFGLELETKLDFVEDKPGE